MGEEKAMTDATLEVESSQVTNEENQNKESVEATATKEEASPNESAATNSQAPTESSEPTPAAALEEQSQPAAETKAPHSEQDPEPNSKPDPKQDTAEKKSQDKKAKVTEAELAASVNELAQAVKKDKKVVSQGAKKLEALSSFTKRLKEIKDPAEKIKEAISYMKACIRDTSQPNFKAFWEVRKQVLNFFKEEVNAEERAKLWDEYNDLSKEAKGLKDILVEKSAFVSEQLDLALNALEEELKKAQEGQFPKTEIKLPVSLAKNEATYQHEGQELAFLVACGSRINAFRKEVIDTQMRAKNKNKFFERLSALGDQVFPKKKELIKTVSEQFMKDVESFVETHFNNFEKPISNPKDLQEPLYFYRDEIKGLQSAAKTLTINTKTFSNSRKLLSKCWDKVKELSDQLKHVSDEKKQKLEENAEKLQAQIDQIKKDVEADILKEDQLIKRLNEVNTQMRQAKLTKEAVSALKDQVHQLRLPILEKEKKAQEEKDRLAKERAQQKEAVINAFKAKLEDNKAKFEKLSDEEAAAAVSDLNADFEKLGLLKSEGAEYEQEIQKLGASLASRKAQSLLTTETKDFDLESLCDHYQTLGTFREEVKARLEELKKEKGASGLDFMTAMSLDEQINNEKLRYEELEKKISELENRINQDA